MNEISFWNNWAKPYKIFTWVLLALLAGSILYLIAVMWLGAGLVIDWQTMGALEGVEVPLFSWQHPLLPIELETSTYVVRQSFLGSELQIQLWPARLLLTAAAIGLSVALAVISSLRRFWYIAGIAIFCVLIVSLRLEQIRLFGRIDKTADVIVFLLFLPLSYYFQSIRPSVGLVQRALSFLGLFALIGVLIYFFAEVAVPFLYIANYGLPAWLLLSFLLILLVAPEVIAAILYLVTASNTETSRHSLAHFTLASLIYFGNLFLYYLENRGVYDIGLYYISPFWILLISILLGIYTLRHRSINFSNILPYEPQGLLLYIALSIICLGTLSYAFATANDPLIDTFEDAILYTHLGMGFIFFLYIIINFIGLLEKNQRVFQVVYKPRNMPLFTARLVGLIVIFGFYSLHGMYAIYKPMGGYYNGIGDLYKEEADYFLAEQYYKLGSQHRFSNHRSNYALASLAIKARKPAQAMLFLRAGIVRHPTAYAYANLANLYFDNNLYFDGLFTLREGIEEFPAEGRLYNNLGVQFGKTNIVDSALYYLDIARQDEASREAAIANELALLVRRRLPVVADRLKDDFSEGDLFYQNNLLSLYNQAGETGRAPEAVNPAVLAELGGIETAWLLNYALLRPEPDSVLPRQLEQMIEESPGSFYEEQASLALGMLRYNQQNHFAAFRQLDELVQGSVQHQALYYQLKGSWALEQEAPALAAHYFRKARDLDNKPEAGAYLALALAETGKPLEAAEAWLQLPDSLLSPPLQKSKTEALFLLGTRDFSDVPGNKNEAAYKALRWQWGRLSREEQEGFLVQIDDSSWRNRSLLLLAEVSLKKGSLTDAEAYLQQIKLSDSSDENKALLSKKEQIRQRLSLLQNDQPLPPKSFIAPNTLGRLYASASQAYLGGDTLAALKDYTRIMQATPFVEEAYLAAIPLLNQQRMESQAYDFLLKAIEFNPYSVLLKEEYILQSLRLGLEEYAREELEILQKLANQERFESFMQQYKQILNAQQAIEQDW